MPEVRTKGWARIEGSRILDTYKQYGTLTGIPNSEQFIYYGNPEISIENPTSSTHSVVYTVKNIRNYFSNEYQAIHDLDDDWNNFYNKIEAWKQTNTIDINDPDTAYYYVGKPFVLGKDDTYKTPGYVIFYDDSRRASITGSKYRHHLIVLIDEYAVPQIINITAEYNGPAVPISEELDENFLKVIAVYEDGNSNKIDSGYTIEPSDKVVTRIGANIFTVSYLDAENDLNQATFLVQGCKKLESVIGYWDGDLVAYGKEAEKKYFVIIAHYSDDTESTVTDFEFPMGNIVTETNQGLIEIYYKGFSYEIQVPTFEVTQSRLIAYYNGPQVEVDHDFQKSYVSVKIFYSSEGEINKSYYEDIDIENCILDSTLVSKEGVNSFTISYEGKLGMVTTSFVVVGFIPDVKPTDIQASYNGPGVYQGKTFDLERILCNIYYNNGTIKTVKNFIINSNIVRDVGPNDITITYIEGTTTLETIITVNGLENDSTTDNNFFPTSLINNYPIATILNNRYRGPAEGIKTNDYANMIIKNIRALYKIFANLEKQYNEIVLSVSGDTSTKITTLNNVSFMKKQLNDILNDEHYSTGIYKSEDVIR